MDKAVWEIVNHEKAKLNKYAGFIFASKIQALMKFVAPIFLLFYACSANPKDLKFINNLPEGISQSKQSGKPIFLHFTCYGCMGYNEFQRDLITSQVIQDKLNNEFVTLLLHVDDQAPLISGDTLSLKSLGFSQEDFKKITSSKTKGELNAVLEMLLIDSISQPQYVVFDADLNILVQPFGYTGKNRKLFADKLSKGLYK